MATITTPPQHRRPRAGATLVAAALVFAAALPANAATYHISSSGGSDSNNGLSTGAPWQTFTNANALTLQPGDSVLLKRGDTWNQELYLKGSGNASSVISLGGYGTGASPVISRTLGSNTERCVTIEAPHRWRVSGLSLKSAKLGLYLRYLNDFNNQDVEVSDCDLRDMTNTTVDPSLHNYEFAWSCGIWIGGLAWAPNDFVNVLDGLKIRNCTFVNCQQAVGSNWYFPAVYKSRLRNVILEDLYASGCLTGVFALSCVDGGHAWRCSSLYGGGSSPAYGTTSGFLQSCKNFQVDNCEFGWTDQINSPDGVGFDFEGDNEDCSFTNNVCHHNDGAGILVMNSVSDNVRITIANNTFHDNVRQPFAAHGAYDLLCYQATNTGTLTGNGVYRSGSTTYLSPNWGGFTQSGQRLAAFTSVSSLPKTWEFNTTNNAEGWSGYNQWASIAVNGGCLRGTSTGADPYAHSSSTFTNRWEHPYLKVRMKNNTGTTAQVFFITETDSVWNGAKSLNFTINPNGVQNDYTIDLRTCAAFKGVVTKLRLDPTTASGSNMAIDYVRMSATP